MDPSMRDSNESSIQATAEYATHFLLKQSEHESQMNRVFNSEGRRGAGTHSRKPQQWSSPGFAIISSPVRAGKIDGWVGGRTQQRLQHQRIMQANLRTFEEPVQTQQCLQQQRIRHENLRTSELPDYREQRLRVDRLQNVNRRQRSMRQGFYLEAFRYDPTKDYWLHPKAAIGKMNVICLEEGGELITAGESSKSSDMLYSMASSSDKEEEFISASASDSRDCKSVFCNGGRTVSVYRSKFGGCKKLQHRLMGRDVILCWYRVGNFTAKQFRENEVCSPLKLTHISVRVQPVLSCPTSAQRAQVSVPRQEVFECPKCWHLKQQSGFGIYVLTERPTYPPLICSDALEVVEGKIQKPEQPKFSANEATQKKYQDDLKEYLKATNCTMIILINSMTEETLQNVMRFDSPRDVWLELYKIFDDLSDNQLYNIHLQFFNLAGNLRTWQLIFQNLKFEERSEWIAGE
ncbi:hypothetical protein AVEN_262632-1 [Araneus ventricosus]|uniref:Uncharacterized protein n=1 Tax=Araneus ventricosus TaxID=182803 RepID=A0A4Y2NXM2_ARAVE|nr:hypothetical protein AVEN_262632-1 [Araneus ventricosus]